MKKTLIKNGRLIDPKNNIDQICDLLIKDGIIEKVGVSLSDKQSDEINAKGKIVCPGFIDIHVHLREPGREDKETIYTGSRSAAAGGITSVVAMPNTTPPADNQSVIEFLVSKAKSDSIINIFPSGCITKGLKGDKLTDIWEMKKTGAVVITDDGYDVQDMGVYRKAMQYAKTHNMPMLSHSEDASISSSGHMHEGKVSTKLGIPGVPASSEDVATARILVLVEEIGVPMHFTHVSTKGSLELIRNARNKGLRVTADVTPHHFSLTDEAVIGYQTNAKMNPPLRPKHHVVSLLEGLKDGSISVIATDHAPHLWTEKERDFESAPFGIVGFETLLPLIITNLVKTGVLSLSDAISKITCNPSDILNLNKGALGIGDDADITIFDENAEITIDKTKFASKGQNTPFHGMQLNGKVEHVFVKGKQVVKDGSLI